MIKKVQKYMTAAVIGKTLILLVLGFGIFAFLGTAAIFWSIFFAFLFFRWDNRILGALAILALTTCPILLSLELNAYAEEMAAYAYYFLVMTVVLQIIEFKRESKTQPKLLPEGKKPAPVLDLRESDTQKS